MIISFVGPHGLNVLNLEGKQLFSVSNALVSTETIFYAKRNLCIAVAKEVHFKIQI